MNKQWINKKVLAAMTVLTFSCAALATYTTSSEHQNGGIGISVSQSQDADFIGVLLNTEAGLYDIDAEVASLAQDKLKAFYTTAKLSLALPTRHTALSLTQFLTNADTLIQEQFPQLDNRLSVTEALAKGQRSIAMSNWLILSLARHYGVEVSMHSLSDHNHLVVKTTDKGWLEWKVSHILDVETTDLRVMDEYDLWTALDMELVAYYVANGIQGNDASIEALTKAAIADTDNVHAASLYWQFLITRDSLTNVALLNL